MLGAGITGTPTAPAAALPIRSAAAPGTAGPLPLAGSPLAGSPAGRGGPIPGSVLGELWCQPGGGCMAAGYRQTSSTAYTLTERWNGSRWAVVPSPNPSGGTYSGFTDMTCTSSDNCFAGGHYYQPNSLVLIEHWNGARWSIDPAPNPLRSPDNYVYGFGCATQASCFAVGFAYTQHLTAYYPLAERWDGSAWSIVPATEPAGSGGAMLSGVACPTADDCLATGINVSGTAVVHLTERWDGSAWKVIPNALGSTPGYLDGITCASAGDCWALGFVSTPAMAAATEHWNGSRWSRVATPHPAGTSASFLYNATCLSAADCWAAGMSVAGGVHRPLMEHWTGRAWAIVPAPAPSGDSWSPLDSVSCTGPADCLSVGFTIKAGTRRYRTFAERWNGASWSIVPTPND